MIHMSWPTLGWDPLSRVMRTMVTSHSSGSGWASCTHYAAWLRFWRKVCISVWKIVLSHLRGFIRICWVQLTAGPRNSNTSLCESMAKDIAARKEFQRTGRKGDFIPYILDKPYLLRPQILSEAVISPNCLQRSQTGDNLGRPPGTLWGCIERGR